MKALVYTGPETMELREADAPEADGETLVDVAFCGICGSDMHAFLGHDERRPAPLILGHEAAGTTRDGRRVVVNPLVSCMACKACEAGRTNLCPSRQIISMPPREGAFAQVVRLPERNLLAVPDSLPLHVAALTEPLACGWHAARLAERHGEIPIEAQSGDRRPLVLGGGAIGLASALALVAHGAPGAIIVEPNPVRWPSIEAAGPFQAVTPETAERLSPDLVVDAYGSGRSRAQASARVRPGGVVVHVGLANAEPGLDTRRATLQEVTFVGAYTYTAREFADTLDAIANGRLGPLQWCAMRDLSDGMSAFADLRAGRVEHVKIILAVSG
ncbi:MAG: alcohol dehydrogenase catalytic domain-containing protein [Devosia sp.]